MSLSRLVFRAGYGIRLYRFLIIAFPSTSNAILKSKFRDSDNLRTANEPPHDKTNKMTVRPAKTQISLGIRPVWSESSPCAEWVGKDPSFLDADSEDSDQTGRMPRLIWVFAGRKCHFVGFVMRRLKCFLNGKCIQAKHVGEILQLLHHFQRNTSIVSGGYLSPPCLYRYNKHF